MIFLEIPQCGGGLLALGFCFFFVSYNNHFNEQKTISSIGAVPKLKQMS